MLLILILLPGLGLAADSGRSARVDALFVDLTRGIRPGAAVMVIDGGEIVHSRGYGYADLESRLPITADTPFRLASVSKAFTAMAVMMLTEQGKLDFDDPIAKHLPELARFGPVTIRHILTHTSGIPDYYDAWYERNPGKDAKRPSTREALSIYRDWGESLFPPGSKYEYSNPAYEIMAVIISQATGRRFGAWMQENLFSPVGMSSTVIHDYTEPDIPGRAIGYRSDSGGGWMMDDDDPLNNVVGSGGQFSSLNDMAAWDRALSAGGLVSDDTMNEAMSSARGSSGEFFDYGFGWNVDQYRGHERMSHTGSWVGYRHAVVRLPERGLTVIVLSNFAEAAAAGWRDRVLDLYLESPP